MAFLRDNSIFCIPNSTFGNQRQAIGGTCIATSIVGFLGAALQLKSIWQYRNMQRRRPSADLRIILYLALSDMFACLGVFALSICFVKVRAPVETSPNNVTIIARVTQYQSVVATLESITIFSYLASYLWTLSYALDTCFQIFRYNCPMIVYHIVNWLIPLELVAVTEAINFAIYPHTCQLRDGQMIRLILSYVLVPVVIIGNSFLLWLTYKKVKQISKSTTIYTDDDRIALAKFKKKIFLMVFVFTICWLPNIASVCYDIVQISKLDREQQYTGSKESHSYKRWRMIFVYIEALLNPLQGMFNYLVYRNTFKVTATTTRTFQNSLLPSVSSSCVPRFHERFFDDVENTNEIVKKFADSSENAEHDSEGLGLSRSSNYYPYTSRLLGE